MAHISVATVTHKPITQVTRQVSRFNRLSNPRVWLGFVRGGSSWTSKVGK